MRQLEETVAQLQLPTVKIFREICTNEIQAAAKLMGKCENSAYFAQFGDK